MEPEMKTLNSRLLHKVASQSSTPTAAVIMLAGNKITFILQYVFLTSYKKY